MIHNTLLALCYPDMFQPSKGRPQAVRLTHFNSTIKKTFTKGKAQFSEQRVYYAAATWRIC